MDCSMPVMDGCTATALIRQMEAATSGPVDRDPVPIVALTAFAMSRDRERCLQAPALTPPLALPPLPPIRRVCLTP